MSARSALVCAQSIIHHSSLDKRVVSNHLKQCPASQKFPAESLLGIYRIRMYRTIYIQFDLKAERPVCAPSCPPRHSLYSRDRFLRLRSRIYNTFWNAIDRVLVFYICQLYGKCTLHPLYGDMRAISRSVLYKKALSGRSGQLLHFQGPVHEIRRCACSELEKKATREWPVVTPKIPRNF